MREEGNLRLGRWDVMWNNWILSGVPAASAVQSV